MTPGKLSDSGRQRGDRRTGRVTVRCYPDERAAWTETARASGLTLSDYLRRLVHLGHWMATETEDQ